MTMPRLLIPRATLAALALTLAIAQPAHADTPPETRRTEHAQPVIHYRTATIDGLKIFYREAGPADAPAVLLLHGFPTSSNMYRNLIPALARHYRVIAPDYPGFGQSDAPPRDRFAYTFANIANVMEKLTVHLGAQRYALYVMDYGAPVGYRLALRQPERVTALVIQNGNAYEAGLQEFWKPIKAYWASGSRSDRDALRAGLTLAATREQYLDGVSDPTRLDPTAWTLDQALLDRPGNVEVQLDLFYDYRTNVELYPKFHEFFRQHRPPALIVWGKHDKYFPVDGGHAYLRDLPKAELHLLDSGHFALEEYPAEIGALMLEFLDRHL